MECKPFIGTNTVGWITPMLRSMCCNPFGVAASISSPFGCRKFFSVDSFFLGNLCMSTNYGCLNFLCLCSDISCIMEFIIYFFTDLTESCCHLENWSTRVSFMTCRGAGEGEEIMVIKRKLKKLSGSWY